MPPFCKKHHCYHSLKLGGCANCLLVKQANRVKEIAKTWEKIHQLTMFPVTNRGAKAVGELATYLETLLD